MTYMLTLKSLPLEALAIFLAVLPADLLTSYLEHVLK